MEMSDFGYPPKFPEVKDEEEEEEVNSIQVDPTKRAKKVIVCPRPLMGVRG